MIEPSSVELPDFGAAEAAIVSSVAAAPIGLSLDLRQACRNCHAPLRLSMVDLGACPVANDFVDPARFAHAEATYPLQVRVCEQCWLAQTLDVVAADQLFRPDYAYFSSYSSSWLAHAQRYVEEMCNTLALQPGDTVVEIASNDGYLLQFAKARGLRTLGVEPTEGPAEAARAKGLETVSRFFGRETARDLQAQGWAADLMPANNVLAHVPDLNDFVAGFAVLLKPEGVATFEVQHLLRLLERRQFDTIYHEHFSYLSLLAAENLFARQGLRLFDVEALETHGGSFRLFVCRQEASRAASSRLVAMRAEESAAGLDRPGTYADWGREVVALKMDLLELLIGLKRQGARIAAYGAPAKGNTLLNYCGIKSDFIDFTVDRAPSKQNRFLPGSRIPVLPVEAVAQAKPEYLLVLPWNLRAEILEQMAFIRDWGGRFILPAPKPEIV